MLRPGAAHLPPSEGTVHGDTRRRLSTVEQSMPGPTGDRWQCITAATASAGDQHQTGLWQPWGGAVRIDMVVATIPDGSPGNTNVDISWGSEEITVVFEPGDVVARLPQSGALVAPGDFLQVTSHADAEYDQLVVQIWVRGNAGGGLVLEAGLGGGGGG